MKRLVMLFLVLVVAMAATSCDDFTERVAFDVTLEGTDLRVCATFKLGIVEAQTMSSAMLDTFGSNTGTIVTETCNIWNARSVDDLADVIRRSKQ